jgi:hypothetical protein
MLIKGMMKMICLLTLFVGVWCVGYAQEKISNQDTKLFKRAMNLADQGNYKEAIDVFKVMVKNNPEDLDALYNMGLCYLNTTTGADTAVVCFNKGLDILSPEEKKGYLGVELSLSLGMAYQVLLQPRKAVALYEDIMVHLQAQDSLLQEELEHEIQVCQNAYFFINNPIEMSVTNMGSDVNSRYDDHSPLASVGEHRLFFTSRRNWIRMSLLSDGQYAEKIYSVPLDEDNVESARMLKVFFRQNEHEAAASLSPDGDEMILFRNDEHGKSLYLSRFSGQEWSDPEKLPFPINSFAEETHGSISADKSTLFFTSDREGGYGGLDIYMVKRDIHGNWGKPRNLGPHINTEYDEETPMIHYDGKTLYFSSEGHNSMGRLDVFYAEMLKDSSWSKPVNLGYPINTPADDFFFVPTVNKSHAYYASSKFEDNYGGSDIYRVKFENNSDTELAVVEGTVNPALSSNMEDMRILVTRRKDNRLVGDYRPNTRKGTFLLFLEIGYEYEVKQTDSGDNESVAFINVTSEMSYLHNKKPVLFKDVAMDAPLQRVIDQEIEDFTQFAKTKLQNDVKESFLTEMNKNKTAAEENTLEADLPKPIAHKEEVQSAQTLPIANKKSAGGRVVQTNTSAVSKDVAGYTMQLYALKKGPLKSLKIFTDNGLQSVREVRCVDGYTRYIYGVYADYKASLEDKKWLMNAGQFQDIWIRPLKDVEDLKVKYKR